MRRLVGVCIAGLLLWPSTTYSANIEWMDDRIERIALANFAIPCEKSEMRTIRSFTPINGAGWYLGEKCIIYISENFVRWPFLNSWGPRCHVGLHEWAHVAGKQHTPNHPSWLMYPNPFFIRIADRWTGFNWRCRHLGNASLP